MSSLKAINDTMNKVEEYTEETSVSVDRLDKNFQKWFEMQRRAALDAEEDRREAKKAMAAMGAAGRAGKSGNQDQQGGGPGVLASIAAAIAALPPGVKMALGITAGAAAYKTGRFVYRTATLAPFREGAERLGQRLVDKAQEKRRIKDEIAAAEKAEADRIRREQLVNEQMKKEQQDRINSAKAREQARIRRQATALTDIESAADKAASEARARRASYGLGDIESIADQQTARAKALQGQRGYLPENIAKPAAKSSPMPPKITMGTSLLSTPSSGTADINAPKAFDPVSQKFVTQDFGPVNARDLIPNIIESTKRVRLTDVVTDAPTQAKINDIETKNNVRISVTPDGKIDIRSADPSKPGAFVSKDVFNKTMVDLTSPDKPRKNPKIKPKIKASPPGVGTALSIAGLVLEAGDIANQSFIKSGASSVIPKYGDGGPKSTTAGALGVAIASEVARLPGDLVDLGVLGYLALSGNDGKQTTFGSDIANSVFNSLMGERLKQQGGIVDFSGVGGMTVLNTANTIGSAAEIAGESVVAGIQLLSGKSNEDIKKDQVKQAVDVIKSMDPATTSILATALQTPLEQQRQQFFLEQLAAQIEAMGGVAAAMEKLAAQGNNNQLQNYSSGQSYLPAPSFNIREMSVQKILDATSVPNRGNN